MLALLSVLVTVTAVVLARRNLQQVEQDRRIFVNVTRATGKRQTVVYDPANEASVYEFAQALREDNERKLPRELRELVQRRMTPSTANEV